MTLADRIKAERKANKLTQQELADKIGTSKSSVCQWETGFTMKIDGLNLIMAARTLNVNPDWLLTGKGEKRPIQFFIDYSNRLEKECKSQQQLLSALGVQESPAYYADDLQDDEKELIEAYQRANKSKNDLKIKLDAFRNKK